MSAMSETMPVTRPLEDPQAEPIYFCEQHGAMNKLTDLKEKTDQISKRA
jgi:hypothetical protein